MNASRLYLYLALALTISLGVVASWQVYRAAERVAQSNHELVELGIVDLGAIASFRGELVEYERLAYELYSVIDAGAFQPSLLERQHSIESRFGQLVKAGMSSSTMIQLHGHWQQMVAVVDELIENIARIEQRGTNWDAARAQLRSISSHRRQIDPLLDDLVEASEREAQLAERRSWDELTFMSALVVAYAIVILGVAFAVAWLLKRLFAATETNRALARFPARNPLPVVTVDKQGVVHYANRSAHDFAMEALGEHADVGELIAGQVRDFLRDPQAKDEAAELFDVVGNRTLAYRCCWQADHGIYHIYMRDVTTERAAQARLKRMAFEDSLTGLMNRNAMTSKLDEMLELAQEICFSLLRIERFHLVQSGMGFDVADDFLRNFAPRLLEQAQQCLDADIFVARIEGPVFALAWTDGGIESDLPGKLETLMQSLPLAIQNDEAMVHAGYRIGVKCRSRGQSLSSGALLSDAAAALRVAERQWGTRCVFHDSDTHKDEQDILLVEDKLRCAIDDGDRGLQLYLQPKVDMKNGRIVGAEALLRWQDPELGPMSPDRFIPIAEQSGLIVGLGQWVCRQALDILGRWRLDEQLLALNLAVNAAPEELQTEGYARFLLDSLHQAGVAPGRLEIEVTERGLADTADLLRIDALGELRRAGVEVAVDDFGTGYSSLAYLSSLPISQIKIDRRFIEKLPTQGTALARMIVNLTAELGHVSVAEGVETSEQADYLRQIGCDCAQGYYFYRPMPVQDFEAMVRQAEVPA